MGSRSGFPYRHSPIPIPPCPILQAQLEAGVTFKKSTAKGMPELDFVPVNLHIQQMKVGRGEEEKGESRWVWSPAHLTFDPTERVVYTCVTAGCPTAYSHKFKQGGLAKLRATTPLANIGSVTPASASSTVLCFSLHSSANPSTITKTQRGQTLLGMPHTHTQMFKIFNSASPRSC